MDPKAMIFIGIAGTFVVGLTIIVLLAMSTHSKKQKRRNDIIELRSCITSHYKVMRTLRVDKLSFDKTYANFSELSPSIVHTVVFAEWIAAGGLNAATNSKTMMKSLSLVPKE